MLAHIFLDSGIQAARIGIGVKSRMLVTKELPILVHLAALDFYRFGLGSIALDLDMVTTSRHEHHQQVAATIQETDDDGVGHRSLIGEFAFFVHTDPLIDHTRIGGENHPHHTTVEISEFAINLETVTTARGHRHGERQQEGKIL